MKFIEQSDKCEKVESELSKLKRNLSKATAEYLILEESNEKLKKQNVTLSKERTQQVDRLTKSTIKADSIESKIESVTECVGKKVAKDIKDLRDELLKEMYEVKQQIGRSVIQTYAEKKNDLA
jgi:predicted transcriptional regulator